MDGNRFEVDFTCVRTAYTSYCFAILCYFFVHIGLNRFASCNPKLCLYQVRIIFFLFKILRSFDLYVLFVTLK